jgi:acyl carrier protein
VNETAIFEAIRGLVKDTLRVDLPVDMNTDFRRDLRLDSLKLLELVVAIENRFEIILEPGDEAALNTVGDVVRFIAGKVKP